MANKSPIIRFGVTSAGKRSSYWRLRAGVARPELFLEREDYGKNFHFSLHASGEWHMVQDRKQRISWARPGEVVSGYTRGFGIVQPVVVAVREDAPPDDVRLVAVPPAAEATTFSVFFERPGANLVNSWPGKGAEGTTFVGRIPLAEDAGTCCVVALGESVPPGSAEFPRPSEEELRWMRDVATRGPLIMTVIGELSDGAIALIDLRADDGVVATINSALS
jgi:hypothetical protein